MRVLSLHVSLRRRLRWVPESLFRGKGLGSARNKVILLVTLVDKESLLQYKGGIPYLSVQ